MTKKDDYRKSFLQKRLPTILLPYIVFTFLYWGLSFLLGSGYSVKDVFTGLINGYPIVSNSWYIITILLCYLAFWLLMIIFRNRYLGMVLGGCVCYVIYTVCCMMLGYGHWWYNSVHLMVVGMVWAIYEPQITNFLKKHFVVTPLVWVAFVVLFISSIKLVSYIPIRGIGIIFNAATAFFFAASVLLFSTRVILRSKVLKFLGEISLETYLTHGLFIQLFRSDIIFISNDLAWASLVIVCSIASAYLLHLVFNLILSQYKKLISR